MRFRECCGASFSGSRVEVYHADLPSLPLPQVTFPADLDVYDFCTPELKKELEGPRAALKEWEDEQVGRGAGVGWEQSLG